MKNTMMKIEICGSKEFFRQLSNSDSLRNEIKEKIELTLKSSEIRWHSLLYPGLVSSSDKGYFVCFIIPCDPQEALIDAVDFLTDWWIFHTKREGLPGCRIFIFSSDIAPFSSIDRMGYLFSGFHEIALLEKIARDGDIIISDDCFKSVEQFYIPSEVKTRTVKDKNTGEKVHKFMMDYHGMGQVPYIYDVNDLEDWDKGEYGIATLSVLTSCIDGYEDLRKGCCLYDHISSEKLKQKLGSVIYEGDWIDFMENHVTWQSMSLSDREIEKRRILKLANSLLLADYERNKKRQDKAVSPHFYGHAGKPAEDKLSWSGQSLRQIKKNIDECAFSIIIESLKSYKVLKDSVLDRLINDTFPPLRLDSDPLIENFARIISYQICKNNFFLYKRVSQSEIEVLLSDSDDVAYHYDPMNESFGDIEVCEQFVRSVLLPMRLARTDNRYARELGLLKAIYSHGVLFTFRRYVRQF